jgi:hypothetical protein
MNVPVKTVGFYRPNIEQTQGLRTAAESTKHAIEHDRGGEPGVIWSDLDCSRDRGTQ